MLAIAKWSGRADIRQNSAYNHVSDRDTIQQIKELTSDKEKSFGELVTQARVSLIPREEFAAMTIGAAHTTDLGFCVHDFAMSPCPIHGDCDTCRRWISSRMLFNQKISFGPRTKSRLPRGSWTLSVGM